MDDVQEVINKGGGVEDRGGEEGELGGPNEKEQLKKEGQEEEEQNVQEKYGG